MCEVCVCICLCTCGVCRFPVVTWRHPVTKAVLLRSSGFHSKGVIGVFKGHYSAPPTSKSRDYSALAVSTRLPAGVVSALQTSVRRI